MTKIKMALMALGALAIVSVVTFGYIHYQGKLAQIEQLTADNATLTLSVETQQDTIRAAEGTIDDWEEAYERLARRNTELEGIANDAREEQRRLVRMFDELDIAGSAVDDPVGLQGDLNRRFSYLNCLLTDATGTGSSDCASRLDPGPTDDTLP